MEDPAGAVKCAVQKKKDTRAMEDADLYELYLRQYAKKEQKDEAERVLEAGEVLGCMMVDTNQWQITLRDAITQVDKVVLLQKGGNDEALRLLKALPLRVEDWGDINSAVSFIHKTIAEYLCARRLLRVADTLATHLSGRCFSQDTPN
eukprot:Hpha_TRINITY_DN16048_c3_g1::TRINITY_DN16048_c3_g1_i23::g.121915::m.121915